MIARLTLGATAALLAGTALAQTYPARAIRIVVPFVAGGPTDVQARWSAQRLNQAWGQPVVVENRGGAGGITGTDAVAKAAPDGYTILGGNPGPLTVAPNIYSKLPYDPVKSFQPVTLLAIASSVLCAHPSVPARNLKELIALAKAQPGKLNYGSPGVGTVGHLGHELLNFMGGIKTTHVPYKGAAQTNVDLMAGHIDIAIAQIVAIAPHARQGKVRAIAATGLKRSPVMPEVPTLDEQGLKGYQSNNWTGFLVPAGTPREIVSKLQAEIARFLNTPESREYHAQQGLEVSASTPEQYAEYLRAETEKWGKVARAANVRAD